MSGGGEEGLRGVVTSAKARLHNNSIEHGIVFMIEGENPLRGNRVQPGELQIDVFGDVWRGFPAGVGTMARVFLPFTLGRAYRAKPPQEVFDHHAHRFRLEFSIGTKEGGQIGVTHTTIRERLNGLVACGDPVFLIELRSNAGAFYLDVPTKASLILKSIEAAPRCADILAPLPRGGIPKTRSRLRALMAWWALPLLFTLFNWGLALAPPDHPGRAAVMSACATANSLVPRSVGTVLPPHPATMSQCWQLAQLATQLGGTDEADVLSRAAVVLGDTTRGITAKELAGMASVIADVEAADGGGLVTRVLGLYSFVNMMWLIAIVGIAVSVGPATWHVLKPVRDWLVRVVKWAWRRIIWPFVLFCHNWFIFEAAAYVFCAFLVGNGHASPAERGLYLALTGLALSVPAFGYSTFLHAPMSKNGRDAFYSASNLWIASILVPNALFFDSTLTAFLAVISIFAALGFSVACYGLCYCIGFKEGTIERCMATSALLLTGFTAARASKLLLPAGLGLFQTPVNVFGGVVLFLGLLIFSSKWYRYYDYSRATERGSWWSHFTARQALMIFCLLNATFWGNLFAIPSLTNTAYVFVVMYLVEKYTEIHIDLGLNGWVLVLALSLLVWRVSLYLHVHPDIIVDMFSG
eukprot:Hpha_TRINITY_DN15987_c2_g1::TRINITY_DN15987_c2_g1_i1::g.72297::m.72297